MTLLLLAAVLSAVDPAPTEPVTPPSPAAEHATAIPPELASTEAAPRLRLLGVQLAAGAPQGGVVSVVVRPWKWVRGDLGFAHNSLAPGFQAGVTLVPFHWAVTPTFRVEYGKYSGGDITEYLDEEEVSPALQEPLKDFGYSYWSTQLGLEFGSQNAFTFFLRGGLAWLSSDLDDVRDYREGDTTVDVSGASLSAVTPTVNLGFLVYFW